MGVKLKVASLFCGCGGTDVGRQGDFDYLGTIMLPMTLKLYMQTTLNRQRAIFLKRILG